MLISVIVTTYNWPQALEACIRSLFAQTDNDFEVVIADDGSTETTKHLIERINVDAPIKIQHIWQQDKGFRAATCRNKAVAACSGDYVVFLDGDCAVLPNFICQHRRLAESGFFIAGNRVLLSEDFSQTALIQQLPVFEYSLWRFCCLRIQGKLNRLLPFIFLPATAKFRYKSPVKWQKAMTCNLAMYKQDFIQVNGFDELFQGWGFEDSDLVIRLIHQGVKRKEGRFAVPVLHYWHKENDRSQHDENYARLQARLADHDCVEAKKGIKQYLA
jgi:GT2 family glycosyltransferase